MSRDGKVVTMSQESQLTTALAEAAATAGHAPSVHNTQPWRWRVLPDALELRSVADRQLAASDPEGRLLAISCGTALHHARLALAAEGWRAVVERLPDPADSELLARLTDLSHTTADPDAMRWCSACRSGTPTGGRSATSRCRPTAIEEISRAAGAEGCRLQILDPDQMMELAATAGHADTVEAEDPRAARGAGVLDQPGRRRHRPARRGAARAACADHRAGPRLRPPRQPAGGSGPRPDGGVRAAATATRTSRTAGCGRARRSPPVG